MEQRPKKLLEQVRDAVRLKHYSYQTEKTYVHWIKRYILFHNKRHPKDSRILFSLLVLLGFHSARSP